MKNYHAYINANIIQKVKQIIQIHKYSNTTPRENEVWGSQS